MRTEKELLEKALSVLTDGLKEKHIKFAITTGDGRLNSAANEDDVVEQIRRIAEDDEYFVENELTIGTPNLESNNNREWYDFSIESKNTSKNNYFIPVNIKITNIEHGAADNLSCKLGLFYALTGCLPKSVSIGQGTGWSSFFSATDKHMAFNKEKDYYFLVINKDDTGDVFWNSLRRLQTLTPNGNNLPFQCKWSDNRTQKTRTYHEARDFILSNLYSSIQKRETVGKAFDTYLKKYIGLKTDLVVPEDEDGKGDN